MNHPLLVTPPQPSALEIRLTSVCWAIYVMVTFYIDVQDRKLQEIQKLENQTETTGEYIPEYDYYESTDFQLPLRFRQENFQNSRLNFKTSFHDDYQVQCSNSTEFLLGTSQMAVSSVPLCVTF